jgi:hypothetical protein
MSCPNAWLRTSCGHPCVIATPEVNVLEWAVPGKASRMASSSICDMASPAGNVLVWAGPSVHCPLLRHGNIGG